MLQNFKKIRKKCFLGKINKYFQSSTYPSLVYYDTFVKVLASGLCLLSSSSFFTRSSISRTSVNESPCHSSIQQNIWRWKFVKIRRSNWKKNVLRWKKNYVLNLLRWKEKDEMSKYTGYINKKLFLNGFLINY